MWEVESELSRLQTKGIEDLNNMLKNSLANNSKKSGPFHPSKQIKTVPEPKIVEKVPPNEEEEADKVLEAFMDINKMLESSDC